MTRVVGARASGTHDIDQGDSVSEEPFSRPAYGFQRRVGQLGEVDEQGYLVSHPQEPLWDIYTVTAEVDLDQLRTAWRAATADIDTLNFRLRRVGDRVLTERLAPVPAGFDVHSVPKAFADGALHPDVVALVDPLVTGRHCAPGAPTAWLRVVRDGENTLLTIVVDHTVGDGWSLALLVRRFAMAHRLLRAGKPLELRPLGGFADFLDRLPDAPTRRRNLDRWRELLADTTPPGPPTLFEKDGPDPDRAFLLDTHHVFPVEPRVSRAANVLAQRYGTNPAEIWVAAAILAATRNSRGPQPSITMHHGRTRRADFRVFGPLTEAHVTPAVPADRTLEDQWRLGRESPPLFGETLREEGLFTQRRFAIDHVPVSPPLVLDREVRGRSLTGKELEPLKPPSKEPIPSAASVWITIYPLGVERAEVLVEAASSALPEPESIVAAMRDALVSAAGDVD